jgi:hypothetical protein
MDMFDLLELYVLAVILYHKLAFAWFQAGAAKAISVSENWLQ